MSLVKIDAAKLAQILLDTYRQALQARIDATARERGYENGYTLASYALSTIPEWRAEAEAFIAWRDRAWVEALDAAAQVEAGTLLADTDYVALTDYDKSKPDVIAQRQEWRDEIRELEPSDESPVAPE